MLKNENIFGNFSQQRLRQMCNKLLLKSFLKYEKAGHPARVGLINKKRSRRRWPRAMVVMEMADEMLSWCHGGTFHKTPIT